MAEEEKDRKEDHADADAGQQLNKMLTNISDGLMGLHKRMDEMEDRDKKRSDAEETIRYFGKGHNEKKDGEDEEKKDAKADKAEEEKEDSSEDMKKDEEKEEKKDAKSDAKADAEKEEAKEKDSKKDAEKEKEDAYADSLADMRATIKRMERSLPKDLTDDEFQALAKAQSRADAVFHAFGTAAPLPLRGENSSSYSRRIAAVLKEHSSTYKDVNISDIANEKLFGIAQDTIYADAMQVALSQTTAPKGDLRAVKKTDGGHTFITYVGEPAAWMNEIAGSHRSFVKQLKYGGVQ